MICFSDMFSASSIGSNVIDWSASTIGDVIDGMPCPVSKSIVTSLTNADTLDMDFSRTHSDDAETDEGVAILLKEDPIFICTCNVDKGILYSFAMRLSDGGRYCVLVNS